LLIVGRKQLCVIKAFYSFVLKGRHVAILKSG
jgi:hypothetical protein